MCIYKFSCLLCVCVCARVRACYIGMMCIYMFCDARVPGHDVHIHVLRFTCLPWDDEHLLVCVGACARARMHIC